MPRRTRPRCGPTWRSAGSTTASRSTRRAGSRPTTPSSPSRPPSSWTAPGGCATAPSARSRTTGWCSGSADCPDASVYDPFRLQLLTLSLDSQVVLVVFGIMLAGLAARVAARSQGLRAAGMPGLILDGALCALLGARLGWIALHLEYYLRLPTQVLAFGDGGYLFAGGALALG